MEKVTRLDVMRSRAAAKVELAKERYESAVEATATIELETAVTIGDELLWAAGVYKEFLSVDEAVNSTENFTTLHKMLTHRAKELYNKLDFGFGNEVDEHAERARLAVAESEAEFAAHLRGLSPSGVSERYCKQDWSRRKIFD